VPRNLPGKSPATCRLSAGTRNPIADAVRRATDGLRHRDHGL